MSTSDPPRFRSGNLTEEAWKRLRNTKFTHTTAAQQPSLSDIVIAALDLADRNPASLDERLTERAK